MMNFQVHFTAEISRGIPGVYPCHFLLHCEVVLAAMALYPEPAIQDDTNQLLTNIAKVLSSPDSISKSDPMPTGIAHWGYQGVKAMLSSLLQAFPLFTADIQ
jgi:hypothetical protein